MPKTRLRIHVELDLIETRITPTPRRRDPRSAKRPQSQPHVLTVAQIDLWRRIRDRIPKNERITAAGVLQRVRAALRAGGQAEIAQQGETSVMIEVLEPRD